MANNIITQRDKARDASKYTSEDDGFWSIMTTISAGPDFMSLKRRSTIAGSASDTSRIREYFRNARIKLRLHGNTN